MFHQNYHKIFSENVLCCTISIIWAINRTLGKYFLWVLHSAVRIFQDLINQRQLNPYAQYFALSPQFLCFSRVCTISTISTNRQKIRQIKKYLRQISTGSELKRAQKVRKSAKKCKKSKVKLCLLRIEPVFLSRKNYLLLLYFSVTFLPQSLKHNCSGLTKKYDWSAASLPPHYASYVVSKHRASRIKGNRRVR